MAKSKYEDVVFIVLSAYESSRSSTVTSGLSYRSVDANVFDLFFFPVACHAPLNIQSQPIFFVIHQ
jgi:hypothetical protein